MRHEECLRPCDGMYVDVKKSPVEIVQSARYQILMNDYINYTWFQNDISNQKYKLWMVRMYIDVSLVCFINDIISSRYTAQHHIKVRQDLFWHPNIWQNHQGPGSKVCWPVVGFWRNHGTPHWVLHHQWSGDSLLCYQIACIFCN